MANGGLRIAAAIALSSRIAAKRRNGAPASWMVTSPREMPWRLSMSYSTNDQPVLATSATSVRPRRSSIRAISGCTNRWLKPSSPPATTTASAPGLNQRDALVGGAMDDRIATGGEAVALLLGVRRGLEIDSQAALVEKSTRLRCVERQRLRAGKHHDGELGGGHRRARGMRREACEVAPASRLRRSAASRSRPGGWPGPDRAGARGCRHPTIRHAWRCAAGRSRECPRSRRRSATKSARVFLDAGTRRAAHTCPQSVVGEASERSALDLPGRRGCPRSVQ